MNTRSNDEEAFNEYAENSRKLLIKQKIERIKRVRICYGLFVVLTV